jgi:hypothetical protein
VTAVRLPAALSDAVDRWVAAQEDEPGRSEAIRRLIELGLTVETPARPAGKPGRSLRAQELAIDAIEKIIDPAAPRGRARRATPAPH